MGGNPYSIENVMKETPKKEQRTYISPEQVDFSKVDFSKVQIAPFEEKNVLHVAPEFKTIVTKKPLTQEEVTPVSEYFKLYDEQRPKAELEQNIIDPIKERFTKGAEQVSQGDYQKGALNLGLGVMETAGSPFAVLDQSIRKIPHIGGTVADIIASPFVAVDAYTRFGNKVQREVNDFFGTPNADEETQKLIDDFTATVGQFAIAPLIVKGLKSFKDLPILQKKQVLADITADVKQRAPELEIKTPDAEVKLPVGEKPVEGINKRLQIETPEVPKETVIPTIEEFVKPEGQKERGFFKRVQDKVGQMLGEDVKKSIAENPDSYYTPQKLQEIKDNLKDMSDTDLIENMTNEGLLRIPVSADPKNNIYVLKELERYNRAVTSGDKVLGESIINNLNELGTSLGQLVRQYREFKTSTPAGIEQLVNKQLEKMNREITPEQSTTLKDLSANYLQELNKLKEADRILKENFTPENMEARLKQTEETGRKLEDMDKFIYEVTPRGIWDTFTTIQKGALLTIESLLQNPVSNLIFKGFEYPVKLIATPFDMAFSKISGRPRQIKHGLDLTWDYLKDTGTELIDATKKLWKGNIKTTDGKYEIKQSLKPFTSLKQAITGKNLPIGENGKVLYRDRMQRLIEGVGGMYAEPIFRMLNLGDQPVSRPTYKSVLRELGKGKGLKETELKKFVEFPDEVSKKIAEQEALSSIFTEDTLLTEGALYLRSMGNNQRIPKPLRGAINFAVNSILPYVKVPLNVALQITDFMIPTLPLAKSVYHFSKGNSRKGAMNLGKAVVGASLIKGANYLVDNGIITGSPSTVAKERELQYAMEFPNSINITALQRLIGGEENPKWQTGDVIVNYRKFGLLGAVFGVTADTTPEEREERQSEFGEVLEMTLGTFTNYPKVFKYITDQSFLKGTNTFLNTLASGDTDKYDDFFKTWFTTMFSTIAPNQLSAITRANVEYMPEKRDLALGLYDVSYLDYLIKERTQQWGEIEKMPRKVGLFGDYIKQTPKGQNAWFYNLFDISKSRNIDDNPLAKEVLEIYKQTKDLDVVPPIPKNTLTVHGSEITLKGKQYEQFKVAVGKERKAMFELLLVDPEYQALDPEKKIELLKQAWQKGYENAKEITFPKPSDQKKPSYYKDKKKKDKPYLKDFFKQKKEEESYFYVPN